MIMFDAPILQMEKARLLKGTPSMRMGSEGFPMVEQGSLGPPPLQTQVWSEIWKGLGAQPLTCCLTAEEMHLLPGNGFVASESQDITHTVQWGEFDRFSTVLSSLLLQNLPEIYFHPPDLFVTLPPELSFSMAACVTSTSFRSQRPPPPGSLPWFLSIPWSA